MPLRSMRLFRVLLHVLFTTLEAISVQSGIAHWTLIVWSALARRRDVPSCTCPACLLTLQRRAELKPCGRDEACDARGWRGGRDWEPCAKTLLGTSSRSALRTGPSVREPSSRRVREPSGAAQDRGPRPRPVRSRVATPLDGYQTTGPRDPRCVTLSNVYCYRLCRSLSRASSQMLSYQRKCFRICEERTAFWISPHPAPLAVSGRTETRNDSTLGGDANATNRLFVV